VDFGLWTVDRGLRTVDCGPWTVDRGLWTVDCGLRTVDVGRGANAGGAVQPPKRRAHFLAPFSPSTALVPPAQ